jgi:hypothetical protein
MNRTVLKQKLKLASFTSESSNSMSTHVFRRVKVHKIRTWLCFLEKKILRNTVINQPVCRVYKVGFTFFYHSFLKPTWFHVRKWARI